MFLQASTTSDGDQNFSKFQAFLLRKNYHTPSRQSDKQRRNDADGWLKPLGMGSAASLAIELNYNVALQIRDASDDFSKFLDCFLPLNEYESTISSDMANEKSIRQNEARIICRMCPVLSAEQ